MATLRGIVRSTNFLSGVAGGAVVLICGVVLFVTGVLGGSTREVVSQAPLSAPASNVKPGSTASVGDIYRRAAPGVVFVQAPQGGQGASPFGLPQPRQGLATGSGFVLDDSGNILTNAHVVSGAQGVQVSFGDQTNTINANIAGIDPSTDTAVLHVDPGQAKLVPLPLGDSSALNVGDPAIAIGNPFGFDRTVTAGIVSALQRQIQAPNGFSINNVIQTDASINPGNSGGPLLDAFGRVIGINSQIATGGSQGSVGIGFAIPINTAKKVLPQLERGAKIQRAYLGLVTAPVTTQLAHDLKLPVNNGALIQAVVPNGPSAASGLRAGNTQTPDGLAVGGDIIVGIEGRPVTKPDDLVAAIADKRPGDTVTIAYVRGADHLQTTVKLGAQPAQAPGPPPQQGPGGGGGGLIP